jgi:hypothetical protein
VLFLRETHEVAGPREREFEAALRDAWLPGVAATAGARLLYVLRHVHGTGPSYRIVTWTALRDAAAWEELAGRVERGDLRATAGRLDELRHDVTAKLLVPLSWSPLQAVDLPAVPTRPPERPLALFMEDTVHPYEGRLEEYVERAGSHYAREMREHDARGRALLHVEASFRTAFGSHRRREVLLWQRVVEPRGLLGLLTREIPDELQRPGSWMHDALALRDRWRSRLLRTLAWSPLA